MSRICEGEACVTEEGQLAILAAEMLPVLLDVVEQAPSEILKLESL